MIKKKVCFIAQFPPPIHGLSKAVETLYNSELQNEFEFEKVDITNNKKFLKNLITIWKSKSDLFYFTISQTKWGNVRDLVVFKLLRIQKKKCLVHLHGGYYRNMVDNDIGNFQRKQNFKAIKKINGVIVLSNSLRSIFQGMIEEQKIYVVPNCIDNQFLISDNEFERKLIKSKSKEVLHVLYLSNFIKSKGYRDVLELAKFEKERCSNKGEKRRLHFDFAGKFFEEREKSYFDKFIADYQLNDYITYHGIVGGKEKKQLLKESDIFVLLTRYPNEGQPISILEAMGNGLFIVTTDHAGIPDIVRDEVNGIIMRKSNTVKKLYKNIIKLYDFKLREKIIINNRIEVKKKYTEEIYIENMKKVKNKILNK